MRLTRRTVLAGGAAGLVACRSKHQELAEVIQGASRENVLQRVAAALGRGASAQQMLTACFALLLEKGADWEDVHALLVVPSILFHFNTAGLLPVFWCAANARDWPGQPSVAVSPNASGDALERAFVEGDPALADAAVLHLGVGAAPLLATEATRSRADPHGAIYAAQGSRMAPLLDERHRLLWVRSLARHLARTGPPAAAPAVPRFDARNTASPSEIARALRDERSVSLDGLAPNAVWEALAILALGTRFEDPSPSGVGVHQTTTLDALWFIDDSAPSAQRAEVLSRAVPFVLSVRNPVQAPLPPALPPAGLVQPDVEALRREVALKGSGEHDFKYFGAVDAIAPRLSPAFQKQWWSGTTRAHPIGSAYRWERAPEAEALIAKL